MKSCEDSSQHDPVGGVDKPLYFVTTTEAEWANVEGTMSPKVKKQEKNPPGMADRQW